MEAEVTGLIEEGGRVAGVRVKTPDGPQEIRADLVVGADGRHSVVRERAGLAVENFGAPIDVLWMRLSRRAGRSGAGARLRRRRPHLRDARSRRLLAVRVRDPERRHSTRSSGAGIEAFRATSPSIVPFLRDRVGELRDWDDIKLLTVARRSAAPLVSARAAVHRRRGARDVADRRRRHQPRDSGRGGGGQHPGGAAGRAARCSDADLARVQRRRELPTRMSAGAGDGAGTRVMEPALSGGGPQQLPLALKLLRWFPMLRRIPARLVGIGVRPSIVGSHVVGRKS